MVALLPDFFEALCGMSRIPRFPRPCSYLIMDATRPVSFVFTHLLRIFGQKIILHTEEKLSDTDLEAKNPDSVIIRCPHSGLLSAVFNETYKLGVGCIIDCTIKNRSAEALFELAQCLSVGGTFITTQSFDV